MQHLLHAAEGEARLLCDLGDGGARFVLLDEPPLLFGGRGLAPDDDVVRAEEVQNGVTGDAVRICERVGRLASGVPADDVGGGVGPETMCDCVGLGCGSGRGDCANAGLCSPRPLLVWREMGAV